ncbi:MAG TPA: ABC transporter permease [Acidimicrobiales bacterium]
MTHPVRQFPRVVWVLAALGALVVVTPVAALLIETPWSSFGDVLGDASVRGALARSVGVAVGVAALSAVLGVPLALVLARSQRPWAGMLRRLVVLPLVLPPVAGGVALLLTVGRRGLLGGPLAGVGIEIPFTIAAVVVAQLFVAMPFVVVTVEAADRALPPEPEEIAATLGAGPARRLRSITLPRLGGAIGSGVVLSWARAMGELGATLTLAGNLPGRTQTGPLLVLLALESDPNAAVVVSVALLVVSVVLLVAGRGRWVPYIGSSSRSRRPGG